MKYASFKWGVDRGGEGGGGENVGQIATEKEMWNAAGDKTDECK